MEGEYEPRLISLGQIQITGSGCRQVGWRVTTGEAGDGGYGSQPERVSRREGLLGFAIGGPRVPEVLLNDVGSTEPITRGPVLSEWIGRAIPSPPPVRDGVSTHGGQVCIQLISSEARVGDAVIGISACVRGYLPAHAIL